MNRPGESGDSFCCIADLGEAAVVTVVGMLEFGGRDVAPGLEQAPGIEPGDVVQGGDLHLFSGAPGPARCASLWRGARPRTARGRRRGGTPDKNTPRPRGG